MLVELSASVRRRSLVSDVLVDLTEYVARAHLAACRAEAPLGEGGNGGPASAPSAFAKAAADKSELRPGKQARKEG